MRIRERQGGNRHFFRLLSRAIRRVGQASNIGDDVADLLLPQLIAPGGHERRLPRRLPALGDNFQEKLVREPVHNRAIGMVGGLER
jgi:hypothetical protein